jgi:ABC-type transport system substrate-binding protein
MRKFHEGQDFTADDVIFSAYRVISAGSDLKGRIPADAEIVKVDDYTVDFLLKTPGPLLINEWETWGIFSKSRSEAHGATEPTPMNATTPPYAGLHANGTGPFILVSHEPGVKTIWKRNPNWWEKPKANIDEVVFAPIPNAATRVAALLSGEVDWMDPVPLNDQARVNANPGTKVLAGPEIRTILLGMDQFRDELGHSNVKGKNPFKDVRVRKAFYEAIDEDAINKKVMRGQATPTALMIAPSLFSLSKDFHRLPFDPAESKKLLAESAIPTASKCRWIARTTAMSMTSRSARRLSACWRGSASRLTSTPSPNRNSSPRSQPQEALIRRSIFWVGRRRRSRASTSSNTSWAAATRRPIGAATTSATIATPRSTRWRGPPCRSRTKVTTGDFSRMAEVPQTIEIFLG